MSRKCEGCEIKHPPQIYDRPRYTGWPPLIARRENMRIGELPASYDDWRTRFEFEDDYEDDDPRPDDRNAHERLIDEQIRLDNEADYENGDSNV